MSVATLFTVCVLALLAVVAILAFAFGVLFERGRGDERVARAESEGFEQGADVDNKARRIGERARRLGR